MARGSGDFICELAPAASLSASILGLGFPGRAKPLSASRLCRASKVMEDGQGACAHAQEMWSPTCCEQPGGLRPFWLSGVMAPWGDGVVLPQGPLLRMGVLMGAGLGLGKDQGLDEDQEKGTRMLV